MLLNILSKSLKMWLTVISRFNKFWLNLTPKHKNILNLIIWVLTGIALWILITKYGLLKAILYSLITSTICILLLILGQSQSKLYQKLGGNRIMIVDGIPVQIY